MITGFHHIVLFCEDTATSKAWFEQVGFAYKRGYHGMHWFALGGAEIMLHPGGAGTDVRAPIVHVAVTDVDALFTRVKSAGLAPFDHQSPTSVLLAPVTRAWGEREFELRDPDGQVWAFTETGTASRPLPCR